MTIFSIFSTVLLEHKDFHSLAACLAILELVLGARERYAEVPRSVQLAVIGQSESYDWMSRQPKSGESVIGLFIFHSNNKNLFDLTSYNWKIQLEINKFFPRSSEKTEKKTICF